MAAGLAWKREGGLPKLSPAGPVFFCPAMARADHWLTAVLAVQLPWRMLHCSDFQAEGRHRSIAHLQAPSIAPRIARE